MPFVSLPLFCARCNFLIIVIVDMIIHQDAISDALPVLVCVKLLTRKILVSYLKRFIFIYANIYIYIYIYKVFKNY